MPRGKYIVIEGNDGTGKSTQVELLRKKLTEAGIESIEFHEPQGSPIADEIRTVIKNGSLPRDGETNVLLFTAARHEIWKEARLVLDKGVWVIAARNYFSTLAYQGYGEGIDLDLIRNTTAQFTDERYMNPDLGVVLTLASKQERVERISRRGKLSRPDTFESRDEQFQDALEQGYLEIAKEYNLHLVSASQTREAINDEIYTLVKTLL